MKKILLGVFIATVAFLIMAQQSYFRTLIVRTAATIYGTLAVTGTSTFTGATTTNAKAGVQQFGLTGSATIAIDSALAAVDTLNLASSAYTWIKVRGKSGTTDSVTTIAGGVSNTLYMFSPVADDTTIVFVDGSNLKLVSATTLDALTDRLLLFYDGTSFVQISPVTSND